MTAIDHGQPSTYTNWGCRCSLCRVARRRYLKHRALVRLQSIHAAREAAR